MAFAPQKKGILFNKTRQSFYWWQLKFSKFSRSKNGFVSEQITFTALLLQYEKKIFRIVEKLTENQRGRNRFFVIFIINQVFFKFL